MIDNPIDSAKHENVLPKLKVVRKNENTYSVQFPFSDVPVEMTHSYFNKNINIDKYVIDFEDDKLPE